MAKLECIVLLLSLSSYAFGQNSSASAVSSSASQIVSSANSAASSASGVASSASSLASVGSSSAASVLSSVAASASSVASSLSSVASSVLSEASSIAASIASSTTPTTSTSSSTSSIPTATESSSSVASTSSSSSLSSSSSSTSTSDTTSTSSLSVFTTSSTSISYASSTIVSTSVIPTTSNGVVGYTTLTTYIVSETPATTYISPYTETQAPASTPSTQADASNSGKSGGLSTGAKIGIGVGVGLAVLAAAIFGGWYSWFMRKRRRRSISASDRYPPSSLPSMTGMMGGAALYQDKSDTRSELPSPGLGGGGNVSPPMRSPDHLIPPGGGVRSWNSVSNSNVPASSQSVSDYSERGGQPPPDASDAQPSGGYVPPGGAIHEMPENQKHQQQDQTSPQQQFAHSRTISGESQPSELGEGTLPPGHQRMSGGSPPQRQTSGGSRQYQHQRTFSGGSQNYQYPSQGPDGYWQDNQNAHELQGSAPYNMHQTTSRGEGYRGVDPEVPLHQRMQTERVPIRPGHLQKPPPGPNLPPSHNY